jgi:hypothetical protein
LAPVRPLCVGVWPELCGLYGVRTGTFEKENSKLSRVSDVKCMTQMHRAICSFANRIESEDSLAKELAPTLVSPWAGSLGCCWAGPVMCGHPPSPRAGLVGLLGQSGYRWPFFISKSFSNLLRQQTSKINIQCCRSPKIMKPILLAS